jgi:hypothetical protein
MIISPIHLSCPWQTALHALQGYNSNSPLLTGLQRVFARPSHLSTRRLLSLLRTTPLYTSGAATCRAPPTEPRLLSAPHLRHRTSPRDRPDHIRPSRRPPWSSFLPVPERTRRVTLPAHRTFGSEGLHPSGSPWWETRLQNNTHIIREAWVLSLNPYYILGKPLFRPRPEVGNQAGRGIASEGHIPQQTARQKERR